MKNKREIKKNKPYDLNNHKDIYLIRRRCKYTITKLGRADLNDEFFCHVYATWLEGKRKGATLDQLGIDFIRSKVGRLDKRALNQDRHIKLLSAKKNIYNLSSSFADIENIENEFSKDFGEIYEATNSFSKIVSILNKYERLILILKYCYEFTYEELSNIMGIEESVVYTHISRIINKIKISWIDLNPGWVPPKSKNANGENIH